MSPPRGTSSKLKGLTLFEGEDDITHIIQAIFPSLCIKFTLNSLAVRFFSRAGRKRQNCSGFT